MKRNSIYRLLVTLMVAFVGACGSGEGPDSTGVGVASLTEKATTPTSGGVANAQPVFRFAKLSSGAYFYTGSRAERDLILRSYPDFRCEGVAFYRTSDDSGTPVFRFANLLTGGYFYTASVAERDFVIQSRSDLRYEGTTFSVSGAMAGAQPVFRLANLRNGAYLYTTNQLELQAAIRLGYWRSEGEGFAGTPQPAGLSVPSEGWCNGADPTNSGTELALMIDSLGRLVAEADFGGGDGGAAGADGSAGDGAPIANRPVVLTDFAGRTARTTTDALGYYRLNIKGFTPPFVVKVTREDGTEWYAPSVTPVKTRGFVTINITGLTDKVGGYVAAATNTAGGAAQVTPSLLAANGAALQGAKTKLNAGLTSPLTYVGLDPSKFDPVTTPYKAVKTDNYDRLLDRLSVAKEPTTGSTTVVGTFAGVKESFVNGPAAVATFGAPYGVAVDRSGNVFMSDAGNNVIRKITPTGVVSTFAGTGNIGFTNGTGAAATFRGPSGVALDSSGNVYVVDTGNQAIRKITPAGVVSTLAGSGSYGFADGAGTAVKFKNPLGVAVDSSGNVFVADTDNHAIRKITPAGVVSTLAGSGSVGEADGIGAAAEFAYPEGIAVDSIGNVFVADSWNHIIRKITPTGVVSTVAGSGNAYDAFADGTGAAASIDYPRGLCIDEGGNLFVTDSNRAIRKITPSGVVSTLAGGPTGYSDGTGTAAQFGLLVGIAVDKNGNVFVTDLGNYILQSITPAGRVSTFAGIRPRGFSDGAGIAATFNTPIGIAVDFNGNVYVADRENGAIRKITPAGVVSTFVSTRAFKFGGAASIASPRGIAVDRSGNVYVADAFNHIIRKITSTGVVSTLAGNGSEGFVNGTGSSASFNTPVGVAVDRSGNVFVRDTGNNVIRKITPTGLVTTFASNGSAGFAPENASIPVEFFEQHLGIGVDSSGNVYASDLRTNAILKMSPAGAVSTLAGGRSAGSADGIGTAATFYNLAAIAVDDEGNVFVTELGNQTIRKITPAGVVSTLAGGKLGYANGPGTTARFSNPQGIAVGQNGHLFVSDTGNHAIRVILP